MPTKTKRIHIRINYYCFVATRTIWIWIWFSFVCTWCHDLLIFVVASVFVPVKQNQRVFICLYSQSVFQVYGSFLSLWLLLGNNIPKQHHRVTCNWIHNPCLGWRTARTQKKTNQSVFVQVSIQRQKSPFHLITIETNKMKQRTINVTLSNYANWYTQEFFDGKMKKENRMDQYRK